MATLTPNANPHQGFPLVLKTQKPDGDEVQVIFPNTSAVEVNRKNLVLAPRLRASGPFVAQAGTATFNSTEVEAPLPQLTAGDLVKIAATGAGAGITANGAANMAAATAGQFYNFTASIYRPLAASWATAQVSAQFWNGTVTTTVPGGVVTIGGRGWNQVVTPALLAPAGTINVGIRVTIPNSQAGDVLYIAAPMIEVWTTAGSWFDGASEASATWDGAAFGSTSTMVVDPSVFRNMRILQADGNYGQAAT